MRSGKSRLLSLFVILSVMTLPAIISGCGNGEKRSAVTPTAPAESAYAEEQPVAFHANDDIAMVLSSLVDALRVDEPFDSTAYNFRGVLTDGTGRPLYTERAGRPGEWDVKILDERSAEIRNLAEGDLLPSDLIDYLVGCLRLSPEQRSVTKRTRKSETIVYTLEDGTITFVAPGKEGLNGCRIVITIKG